MSSDKVSTIWIENVQVHEGGPVVVQEFRELEVGDRPPLAADVLADLTANNRVHLRQYAASKDPSCSAPTGQSHGGVSVDQLIASAALEFLQQLDLASP